MIYQLYYRREHEQRLFRLPLYRGLGLEPEVNPMIAHNCAELEDPRNRLQLVEYGGLLHLWRNEPDDGHDWIGTTSFRQSDKTGTLVNDRERVEFLLEGCDVVTWFWRILPVTLAAQAELCHPGINDYLELSLREAGREIPEQYWGEMAGVFAEYWLMHKKCFREFMDWLYPLIEFGLANLDTLPYLRSHPKALGYALERSFILWYLGASKRVGVYTGGRTKPYSVAWTGTAKFQGRAPRATSLGSSPPKFGGSGFT